MKPWRLALGIALLLGLLVWVQHAIGWAVLLRPWRAQELGPLLLAAVLVIGSYALRALRIHDYLGAQTRGRFPSVLRLVLLHNLLNNLLPMRSGEASFPVLMARYFGVGVGQSVSTLLWFRLLDLHTLGVVGLLGAGWLLNPAEHELAASLGWLAALLLLPVPLLAWRGHGLIERRLSGVWGERWRRVSAGLPTSAPQFWRCWLWTVVNWLVKLGVFAWVLQLFVSLSAPAAFLGAMAGDLTSVLPIHGVAGMGTYEAGVMAALVPFGVDTAAALGGAVNLHLFMLGISGVGALLGLALPGRPAAEAAG